MSIKVGCKHHDMRIAGRIVGVHSTEQSVGIKVGGFCPRLLSFFKNLSAKSELCYSFINSFRDFANRNFRKVYNLKKKNPKCLLFQGVSGFIDYIFDGLY